MRIEDLLARINVWWRGRVFRDEHISRFLGSWVKWFPRIFQLDELLVDAVFTLRGPRQVGKTTILKLLIVELIKKIDPRCVVYLPCDIIFDYQELYSILVKLRDKLVSRCGRVIVVADEVTLIDNWERGVKLFVDSGFLKNFTVIACGSQAFGVISGAESLLGRRGKARPPADRELTPMNFLEFLGFVNPELYSGLHEILKDITLDILFDREKLFEKARELDNYVEAMNDVLSVYLLVGGYPKALNEYLSDGFVSNQTYADFIDYLGKDILKLRKSDRILKRVLSRIISTLSTMISWDKLARDSGVPIATLIEYVGLLEKLYITWTAYTIDVKTLIENTAKQKKIHLRDPFFYYASNLWFMGYPETARYFDAWEIVLEQKASIERTNMLSRIIESIIATHMKQILPTYTWKGKQEVDIIGKLKNDLIAIEAKWEKTIGIDTIRAILRMPKTRTRIITTINRTQRKNTILLIPNTTLLAIISHIHTAIHRPKSKPPIQTRQPPPTYI